MNKIIQLFKEKQKDVLAVYFTAGYPALEDTLDIATAIANNGADLVEIGIPFSDPVADGPTIQNSSKLALDNGMSVEKLLEQLEGAKKGIEAPVVLMGYLNPVLQYGVEAFCEKASSVGVDGLILPDLPLAEYESEYKDIFERYGLLNIFLITPQTSDKRIRQIDSISEGFIYMVSSTSTTGAKTGISKEQEAYFERIQKMNLKNPTLIGFGISNAATFQQASQFSNGAIIGSACIKAIEKEGNAAVHAAKFVKDIVA